MLKTPLLILSFLICCIPCVASSPVQWPDVEVVPVELPYLKDVEWTGSVFVAAGEGYLAESVDGATWVAADLAHFSEDCYETVVSGDGGILALGKEHTLFKGADAGWQECQIPEAAPNISVVRLAGFDGTQFLGLVGDFLHVSTNGLDWQQLEGAPEMAASFLTYGNGVWVAAHGTTFSVSTDGVSWSQVDQMSEFNEDDSDRYESKITHLEFSGGKFVASMVLDSVYENNTYATSSDGVNWSLADAPPYFFDDETGTIGATLTHGGEEDEEEFGYNLEINLVHLTSAGEALVVHSGFAAINQFATQSEWMNLSPRAVTSNPAGVAVAVGDDGLILRSQEPHGESSWEDVGLKRLVFVDAASDGNVIVAAAAQDNRLGGLSDGVASLRYTTDGVTWQEISLPGNAECSMPTINYVQEKWFLICGESELYTSDDGITWVKEAPSFSDDPEVEVWPIPSKYSTGNGWFFGFPERGFLGAVEVRAPGRSRDGVTWETVPEWFDDVDAIGFGDGRFLALNEDEAWSSTDGETWESFSVQGLNDSPTQLSYFRGRWFATSFDSVFHRKSAAISGDGVNWEPIDIDDIPVLALGDVYEFRGYLVASSSVIEAVFSRDGVYWENAGQEERLGVSDGMTLPLGDRLVAIDHGFRTLVSEPVRPVQEVRSLNLIDSKHIEMPIEQGIEYRLSFSESLMPESWEAVGDWRSGAGEFLFWTTERDEEKGFYQVESRSKE